MVSSYLLLDIYQNIKFFSFTYRSVISEEMKSLIFTFLICVTKSIFSKTQNVTIELKLSTAADQVVGVGTVGYAFILSRKLI